MGTLVVLEGALRLISGRPGTEVWAEAAAGLISGLVVVEDVVVDSRKAWFAPGAGESLREISELFGVSAGGSELADDLGISPDADFGSCRAFKLLPSLTGLSVIFASSISPSSTSSFPEAVLTIFGAPFTLEFYFSNL